MKKMAIDQKVSRDAEGDRMGTRIEREKERMETGIERKKDKIYSEIEGE